MLCFLHITITDTFLNKIEEIKIDYGNWRSTQIGGSTQMKHFIPTLNRFVVNYLLLIFFLRIKLVLGRRNIFSHEGQV